MTIYRNKILKEITKFINRYTCAYVWYHMPVQRHIRRTKSGWIFTRLSDWRPEFW